MSEQDAQSTFNTRSDQAAAVLKADISRRTGVELPPTPVVVDANGRAPAPPPPAGSYIRAQYDADQTAQLAAQQQAAARQAPPPGQPTPQQVVGQQPVAGTPLQQSDGSQAPPLDGGKADAVVDGAQPQAPQLSEGANNRIQTLIADGREKDRRIAELSGAQGETETLRQQVATLTTERESFLQQHLDELDPTERAAVLGNAQMREMLDERDKALFAAMDARLQPLQEQSQQTEMEKVAARYPGFDMTIHGPLVDMVRAKNPSLTYEMAFKAVAEGDEAVPRGQASAVAVPPVVAAGNGPALPRYMPEPKGDPEAALVEFNQRTNKLIASADPLEQRQGMRDLDRVILERLSGASYEGKPSVFQQ